MTRSARIRITRWIARLLFLTALILASNSWADKDSFGQIEATRGTVSIQTPDGSIVAKFGQPIHDQFIVKTGQQSAVKVSLQGGSLYLGSNALAVPAPAGITIESGFFTWIPGPYTPKNLIIQTGTQILAAASITSAGYAQAYQLWNSVVDSGTRYETMRNTTDESLPLESAQALAAIGWRRRQLRAQQRHQTCGKEQKQRDLAIGGEAPSNPPLDTWVEEVPIFTNCEELTETFALTI